MRAAAVPAENITFRWELPAQPKDFPHSTKAELSNAPAARLRIRSAAFSPISSPQRILYQITG